MSFVRTVVRMETTNEKRVYSCWVVVERAADVPDLWVSHCLNFDILSQGDSPREALESVCEAVGMSLLDDLMERIEPSQRAAAPHEYWVRLKEILDRGNSVKFSEVPDGAKVRIAMQINFEAKIDTTIMRASAPAPKNEPVSVVPMVMPTPAFYDYAAA